MDTNVISELVAKQPNQRVIEWLDDLDPDSIYLSVITIGELRKGIEKLPDSPRRDKLFDWLVNELLVRFQDRILALDVDVMLTWGKLVGRLEQSGRRLSAIDSLIAALALARSCSLVTRNEADFKGVGLKIINPWQNPWQ
ncbi:MAG: type II toxin-antitoxin system VapC family toxin [Anaerolineae bacterium]|nr:type II toxin-antitoxin system VapC family toxin [Thermoflexales bacterium]MDW8408612.1 type II toxin-antitoxin system VapC family toxin [Anaerolineae bacterium]